MNDTKINYIWEFELIEKLASKKNESKNAYLAIAGGLIHNRFENNVVQYFNSVGRKELKRKKNKTHPDYEKMFSTDFNFLIVYFGK